MQAIALACRTCLDLMEEDDLVSVFNGTYMDILNTGHGLGHRGQLKVVGGK